VIFYLILTISVAVNLILFWYVRKVLEDFLYVSGNMQDLSDSLKNFSDHLDKVNQMEIFHGDSTIQGLLEHSKEVIKDIEEFDFIYELVDDDLDDDLGDDLEDDGEE